MNTIRMYKDERPKEGDIVMCKVTSVGDFGSYVELLEYANIQGMIGRTEYSSKRIRNIFTFMNVNKILPAEVIRVDANYIDLSKKSLKREEVDEAWNNYEKNKKVQNIVRRFASLLMPDEPLESSMLHIYQTYVWNIQDRYPCHFEDVFQGVGRGKISVEEFPPALIQICELIYKNQVYTINATLGLLSLHPDGIDVIKHILKETKNKYPQMHIYYVGHSQGMYSEYALEVKTNDRIEGSVQVSEALDFALKLFATFENTQGCICKQVDFVDESNPFKGTKQDQSSSDDETE